MRGAVCVVRRKAVTIKAARAGFNRDEGDKGDKGNPLILRRHSGPSLTIRPIPNSSPPLRGGD